MEHFPAVLVGGPPNSGKSVLTVHLSQALRERGVQHYVLHAAPDGEGDWTHTADQDLVRAIRSPRPWSPDFVQHICQDLKRRFLPLIVDVGGQPTPWQEEIFDHCTHAILLTPDDPSRAAWLNLTNRHGLLLLADLHSVLAGQSQLVAERPVIRGTIAGLEWGSPPPQPMFDTLIGKLAQLFAYDDQQLCRMHLDAAPVETAIDLDRLACTLGVPFDGKQVRWEPRYLPAALDYLPGAVPLGLYRRAPNWLYVALALLAAPAPLAQFDPRLGWVYAKSLYLVPPSPSASLQVRLTPFADYVHLEGILPSAHLDYSQLEMLSAPPIPADLGVVLSGKLPLWLYTSMARTYRAAPWLAAYQPQAGAIIAYSTSPTHLIGDRLSLPRPLADSPPR